MMKPFLKFWFLITLVPFVSCGQSNGAPKLVVGIVVDQMRAEYLYRFKDNYTENGFKRLMREGFNVKNMHYNYVPTATGPGPIVKFESMACGDMIIDLPGELDKLALKLGSRKLCSVDMESYSIYRANKLYPDLKVSVIKSVMDLTSKKDDAYKEYASLLSAELLYYLLYEEIYKIK